jgi:predicted phage terminase large subunit-like protein
MREVIPPDYVLLSEEEIESLTAGLEDASDEVKTQILRLLKVDRTARAQRSFLYFVTQMWPVFISGKHHAIMADAFERVARGELKRLIINMPPRHTKSEFASYLLPAWFLGRFPEKKIIQTAHTAELAVGFGRKVRNLVSSPDFQEIFDTSLSTDSKAAGRWNTGAGGDYFAIGVGGAVTGKGADLLIIDDPHSEQEAKQGNPAVYDSVYEWYTSGPRQRLQPGGAIIIVMCMTGETNVLMSDGTQKQLKDIRPGDMVATFDKGQLAVSRVNNWQSNGVDSIYKIQTQSGKIIRANERHPFLVMNEGVLEWTRLKYLKPGDLLVSLKDATGHQRQKQNQESAGLAKQAIVTTEKTQTRPKNQSGITASGLENSVNVVSRCIAKACASFVTGSNTAPQSQLPSKIVQGASNTGMASRLSSMKRWLQSVATYVTSVASPQPATILAPIGAGNCASTMTMTQGRCEDCSATTATLQLGTERQRAFLNELHRISDFTVDAIVDVSADGQEEVFDVEIDRTENFIANGVVSHNTRWSKKDLTGQILKSSQKDGVNDWEVINFPAILPSGTPLWPGFWSLKELEALKAELPVAKWEAQYQQRPTSEEGAIIKRENWKIWEDENPPPCDYIIQSWDTAFEKSNRSDYSACTTWGVFYQPDDKGNSKPNIIVLDSFKRRMEFPELKKKAYEMWKEWEPDTLIVEKKAAGSPLIYELRKIGIPIEEYTPSKGSDKIARVNAISDMFASGIVWCPETRWADELMEELASFPNGDHDDLVDSTSQALLRFRRGGFIAIDSDEVDEPLPHRYRKNVYY